MKKLTLRSAVLLGLSVAMLAAAGWQVARNPAAFGGGSSILSPAAPATSAVPAQLRTPDATALVPRPPRPRYPERPRVAVLDFTARADGHPRQQAALNLGEAARALVGADPPDAVQWVDRNEVHRLVDEAALANGAGARDAGGLAVGRWARCDLIVTGQLDDTAPGPAALRLAVLDPVTAERVARATLPLSPGAASGRATDADLDAVVAATRDLIAAAHERMLTQRGRPVVSLLYFRNVGEADRLDRLDHAVPAVITQRLEATGRVRLVQIDEPEAAGREQDLLLSGLLAADPDAWRSAADFYLWGTAAEQPDAAARGQAATLSPGEVPVDLELAIWNGRDEATVLTRTVPAADVDAGVSALVDEALPHLLADPPDTISLPQRDAVARRLSGSQGTTTNAKRTRPAPGTAAARREDLKDRRLRAAEFFHPTDANMARLRVWWMRPDPHAPWAQAWRRLDELGAVGRRITVKTHVRPGGAGANAPDRGAPDLQQQFDLKTVAEDRMELIVGLANALDHGRRKLRTRSNWEHLRAPAHLPASEIDRLNQRLRDELAALAQQCVRWQMGAPFIAGEAPKEPWTWAIDQVLLLVTRPIGGGDAAAGITAWEPWRAIYAPLIAHAQTQPRGYSPAIDADDLRVLRGVYAAAGRAAAYDAWLARLTLAGTPADLQNPTPPIATGPPPPRRVAGRLPRNGWPSCAGSPRRCRRGRPTPRRATPRRGATRTPRRGPSPRRYQWTGCRPRCGPTSRRWRNGSAPCGKPAARRPGPDRTDPTVCCGTPRGRSPRPTGCARCLPPTGTRLCTTRCRRPTRCTTPAGRGSTCGSPPAGCPRWSTSGSVTRPPVRCFGTR